MMARNWYAEAIGYIERGSVPWFDVAMHVAKNSPSVFVRACEVSETEPQWLDDVRALWPRGGRKVAAINLYREKTGASLKEAKAAVEDLERWTD